MGDIYSPISSKQKAGASMKLKLILVTLAIIFFSSASYTGSAANVEGSGYIFGFSKEKASLVDDQTRLEAVPLPSALYLLGTGILALVAFRRRK